MMARLAVLTFALVFFAACGEPETPPTLTNVQTKVFNLSCNNFSGCHNGASPAGQLSLEDRVELSKLTMASVADPMRKIIVPGDPASSFMMDKLRNRNVPPPGTSMPPGLPIEEDRIDLVERWIAAGAPND
jgi:hypothetical protein